jgi:hypothetical protein
MLSASEMLTAESVKDIRDIGFELRRSYFCIGWKGGEVELEREGRASSGVGC